jgi:hypothetical protein
VNKKADIVRVYLPPDANTLLSVADHCLRSRNYVNVIVAGKQPALQWLGMTEAIIHRTAGLGIWEWASTDKGGEPDVVMACAGDVPTLETLAAVDLLRQHFPDIKIRVVNVVDLMTIRPSTEHPHGLSDPEFDSIFTIDKPVIFAYHGYPWLIHRLTYRRTNHDNFHIYPGPYEWVAQGIRRFGFHGINHQYCAERTAQLLRRNLSELKVVTCHLGNGCSLAAVQNGQSIDTTMGFTPLEGLMMGTRSGSIDPGILTYLLRERHLTGRELDELLNTKSGLLGIPGISEDTRQIVSSMKEGNGRAKRGSSALV